METRTRQGANDRANLRMAAASLASWNIPETDRPIVAASRDAVAIAGWIKHVGERMETWNVVFVCQVRNVVVPMLEPPMTRAQFSVWLDDIRAPRFVPCPQCWQTHVLQARDFFLEGDRPVRDDAA